MPLAVCATPIGNLEDVTLRVLRELREADVVLCEDTRHTRGLLDRHGIAPKQLLSYHEHNEARRVTELLPRLEAGERFALVSDAGMPGISDPGARLIRAALNVQLYIAEGHALRSNEQFKRHLRLAYGASVETIDLLRLLDEEHLVPTQEVIEALKAADQGRADLLGLLRKYRTLE
jgi:four helix bundle protein